MSKEFDDTRIKQFRLTCGTSILAFINSTDSDNNLFLLEHPYRIIPTMDQNGELGKSILTPFMEMTDNNAVAISMASVVSVVEASDAGKAQFLQLCFSDQKPDRTILDTVLEPVLTWTNPEEPIESDKKPNLTLEKFNKEEL